MNYNIPNIDLGEQQQIAIDMVTQWYKKSSFKEDPIFYLAGYAGTGKTTIVPFILQSLGIDPSQIAFMAYTGKAARVLSKKSNVAVATIHSSIYRMEDDYLDKATNTVQMVFKFNEKSLVKNKRLVILDKVSMVPVDLMNDLLKMKVKVLVLGDPFQLPPVSGDAFFHEGYKPNYFLTDIHRQALDNPIIALSKQIREYKEVEYGSYGESVLCLPYQEAYPDYWLNADQVIVGKNKTRSDTNKWFREQLGYDKIDPVFPVLNDRLVCCRNYPSHGLVNGHVLKSLSRSEPERDKMTYRITFIEDEDTESPTTFSSIYGCGATIQGVKSSRPYWEQKKMVQLDYSYAMTCHKFQGSQADDILFYDEGFGRWLVDNTYWRHLYTAVTRAAKNLIIVR